jgi:hypothetical protein
MAPPADHRGTRPNKLGPPLPGTARDSALRGNLAHVAAACADAWAGLISSSNRTVPYGFVRSVTVLVMATVKAEEVRIPRRAREAVAHHEEVVVVNRERPTFVIVHPDDRGSATTSPRGRPLREALALLAHAPTPDSAFADDMQAVLDTVGPLPADPWAQS